MAPDSPGYRPPLDALVRPLGELLDAEPLTGGMFASTYRVTLDSGLRVVVKLTATDIGGLCRYERGIAQTEARTYTMLAQHELPVPDLLLTDFSRTIVDADVVVTSHVAGAPWSECNLDRVEAARVRRGLGSLMARMHRIHPPAFGYPAPQANMRAATWSAAFTAMVDGILQDAASASTTLPTAGIRDAMTRHAPALDAVKRPAVVHNDLWPANVFLDQRGSITGVIDTERTVWGDPLLDLIGADQLGLWDIDPDLLAGNSAAGGVLSTELGSPTGIVRFALYRLYHSLILATEIDIRGYDAEWVPAHRERAHTLIDASLGRLLT